MSRIVPVLLSQIELDEENHRYLDTSSQRAALQVILDDQKVKLVNLARDILTNGLNPSDLVIVVPHPDYQDKYIAVEGNRRVATLKILESPRLLDEVQVANNINNAFNQVSKAFKQQSSMPIELNCCVVADRDEAETWIERKHGNEMEGVGIVKWDASQKRRFESKRGAPKIEQQAIEFLLERNLIDEDMVSQIATTTLGRILGDPYIRSQIGLDREKGQLYKRYPDAEVAKGLLRIVNDLLGKDTERGRKINVDDVRTKSDREKYIRDFDPDDLPNIDTRLEKKHSLEYSPQTGEGSTEDGESSEPSSNTSGTSSGGTTQTAHDRKKLIPYDQKLNIGNKSPRLKTVFSELKKIDIDKFTNAAGVLLRVFIEISCDKYGEDNGLLDQRLNSTDPQSNRFGFGERARLEDKMKVVVRHLKSKGQINLKDAEAIETIAKDKDGPFLNVNLLHTYVHSGAYNPSPRELKDFWDNVYSMIAAIWS